jgi:class 3 adenylate cyclase
VSLGFAIANAGLINTMVVMAGDAVSPYYAGLNLVAFGTLTFIPWSWRTTIAAIAGIYGPLVVYASVRPPSVDRLPLLATHGFFIAATVTISLVVRHFTERLRSRELNARQQLEVELASREAIIQTKTAEALRLQTLSKQFSPQVVHAIQSGKLNLVESVHRREICAVFVDIVDSTTHVRSVPHEDVGVVIAMFLEDSMQVLLKYDLTIDKFLGDGVLAFSNDPNPRDDFVERAVDAALEMRARIEAHQGEYRPRWGEDLRIRVGIATGTASIGFYGGDTSVKSYTAIGEVVNLASRLCGAGQPGQVIVSGEVARILRDAEYVVEPRGSAALKGFAGEVIPVFEVVAGRRASKLSNDLEMCPDGHGVLTLDTNSAGIYVFACQHCGYVLETHRDSIAPVLESGAPPKDSRASALHLADVETARSRRIS